jgi:hypothetical protein
MSNGLSLVKALPATHHVIHGVVLVNRLRDGMYDSQWKQTVATLNHQLETRKDYVVFVLHKTDKESLIYPSDIHAVLSGMWAQDLKFSTCILTKSGEICFSDDFCENMLT